MSRRGNGPLPGSMKELAGLGNDKVRELWLRYFDNLPLNANYSKQTVKKMIHMIWYKVQCESQNLHIDQKNITKLNRYSNDPEGCIEKSFKAKYHIRCGTEIAKTYKGREYKVLVNGPDEFIYHGQSYKTLSAAAKAICGKKVSGNDFFGINNKGKKLRGGPAFEKASVQGND